MSLRWVSYRKDTWHDAYDGADQRVGAVWTTAGKHWVSYQLPNQMFHTAAEAQQALERWHETREVVDRLQGHAP